jgi:regulator of replication initiation timing
MVSCWCCFVQAKIQDLHQQIEELTQKVGNLQTENAALHSRTSILEKVLDMRNEQIQVMQESKEVSGGLLWWWVVVCQQRWGLCVSRDGDCCVSAESC